MKFAKISSKRILSLVLALALIVSSMVMVGITSAVAISEDENVFTNLETLSEWSADLNKHEGYDYDYQTLGVGATRHVRGIAGATSTGHKIYARAEGVDGSGCVKFAANASLYRGVMFNKSDVSSNAGEENAYVLKPNTDYEVTVTLKDNSSNSAVTFNIMGIAEQNTNVGYIFKTWTADQVSNSFAAYTAEFTTPDAETLGDNIYLSFMILNPDGVSNTVWLDNVTIKESVVIDAAGLVTFNDNGKVYYAYPDSLTALPEGDNGALNCEFLGWVDAEGNAVTEIPAAGAVLYAKYPITTEIPEKTSELTLSLNDDVYGDGALGGDNAMGVYGVVGVSSSSHKIYSRSITRPDGTAGYALKWSSSSAALSSVNFGKNDAPMSAKLENAYELKDNATYSVSFYVYHEKGTGFNASLIATTDRKLTSGVQLGSAVEFTAVNKSWVKYTVDFTTEILGDNKCLTFLVSNPNAIAFTLWLSTVTITETTAGTVADCITFTDGEDVFYAAPGALTALPEGANAPEGEEFLGWYDANGKKVTEVPVAGTVLTAKYGVEPKFIAASTRGESGSGATYKSAGVRFRSRIDVAEAGSATEIGFIAAPTAFLNGMTLPEYATSEGNDAISALVKADGMEEIVYAEITDENGKEFKDYQLVITGLTREGYEQNLLSTEISVAMYYIVDGVVNYTDTIAYSYDDVIAMRGN